MGVQRLQCGLDAANTFCQPPIQCRFRQRRPLPAVRRDNFHHGLGLGQRHTPIFQCASGELTGACRRTPRRDQRFQQAVCHSRAAVDRQLYHILAGVGVRCAEKQCHALVHLRAVQQVMAQHGGVALGVGNALALPHRRKNLADDSVGVRPGDADGGNAALPWRRRQGTDGRMQMFHVVLLYFSFTKKERPTRPPLHGLLFWSFFAYFLCKESKVILRRWYRLRYPLRPPGQAPPPRWLPAPQGSGQSRRYPRFSRSRLRCRGRHGRPRPPCHPRPGA